MTPLPMQFVGSMPSSQQPGTRSGIPHRGPGVSKRRRAIRVVARVHVPVGPRAALNPGRAVSALCCSLLLQIPVPKCSFVAGEAATEITR
jgi:hypothetical protein